MNIHIATDHTGYTLKQAIATFLEREGHTVIDHGANTFNEGDDYPDYVTPCALAVRDDAGSLGIVIGGSGHGEAMAANRVSGVRAATFYGPREMLAATGTNQEDGYDIVRVSRMHNDANILSLGARFITEEEAQEAVTVFITTPFSGDERHVRRIAKF